MLAELLVRNLGVIDEARISFDRGMQVLTGETGAGKTLLVEALLLVCGARADSGVVGPYSGETIVEASFTGASIPPWLDSEVDSGSDSGSDLVDLVISRAITASGRNRAYINGRLATLSQLREATEGLLAIHGQHSAIRLLDVREQLAAVDRAGAAEITELFERYRASYAIWRGAVAVLDGLDSDPQQREREIGLLRFQCDEIEDAEVHPGDDDDLEREIGILGSASELREDAEHARIATEEAADLLAGAAKLVTSVHAVLKSVGTRADMAAIESRDLADELRAARDSLDDDPMRLDGAQKRLALLSSIKRKYGPSLEDVIVYRDSCAERLLKLESADELLVEARQSVADARAATGRDAEALTQKRTETARRLAADVTGHLSELAFPAAEFAIVIERVRGGAAGGLTATGADVVEFRFTANPRHQAQALAKVASGGELARVMLALEMACGADDVDLTLVFDEIDAGIGGETAGAVAQRLAGLSEARQVVCVTHLAQVASRGERHFRVEKSVDGASVELLTAAGRVDELSRMLAGERESEHAMAHAQELLAAAEADRRGRREVNRDDAREGDGGSSAAGRDRVNIVSRG